MCCVVLFVFKECRKSDKKMQGQTGASRAIAPPSYIIGADPGTSGGGTYTGVGQQPSMEDYESIFGPSARDIKQDPERNRRRQRLHLPDALKGANPWLTDRIDGLITDTSNSPFTSIILPYKHIDNVDGKIKWNVFNFDEGMASRVPYESSARVLTQTKRSYAGYTVRQGLAISMEANFMMSPAGRENFKNQLTQVVGSIQYTNDLDVHIALVQAPSYQRTMNEKYFSTGKTQQQMIREYVDLFGFLQKNPNGLDIAIEEAKDILRTWGSKEPNFLLCNSKLTMQLTMTPERTQYFTQGYDGIKRLKQGPNIGSYRGINVIHSKAFSIETGARPRDLLERRVCVAEYYRIPWNADNPNRTFEFYDESKDSWFQMKWSDLVKQARLDGDGLFGTVAHPPGPRTISLATPSENPGTGTVVAPDALNNNIGVPMIVRRAPGGGGAEWDKEIYRPAGTIIATHCDGIFTRGDWRWRPDFGRQSPLAAGEAAGGALVLFKVIRDEGAPGAGAGVPITQGIVNGAVGTVATNLQYYYLLFQAADIRHNAILDFLECPCVCTNGNDMQLVWRALNLRDCGKQGNWNQAVQLGGLGKNWTMLQVYYASMVCTQRRAAAYLRGLVSREFIDNLRLLFRYTMSEHLGSFPQVGSDVMKTYDLGTRPLEWGMVDTALIARRPDMSGHGEFEFFDLFVHVLMERLYTDLTAAPMVIHTTLARTPFLLMTSEEWWHVRDSTEADLVNKPQEIVIIRPNIEHSMLGVILGRGGLDDLGATLWGQTQLECYSDSMHGLWGMSYKYNERAIVFNEKNLIRLWDICYGSYSGGKDSTMVSWDTEGTAAWREATNATGEPYQGASMAVMSFPVQEDDFDWVRNWPSPIAFHSSAEGKLPCDPDNIMSVNAPDMFPMWSATYKERFKKYQRNMPDFTQLHLCNKTAGECAQENLSSTQNALAFLGSMRIRKSDGQMISEVHGCGHHGPDYVGVSSRRNGKGMAMGMSAGLGAMGVFGAT